jgi:S-phase kinase-associated protein 1
MNHHKGKEPPLIEKPLRSRFMIEICKDPWDADFIDRIGEDRKDLYDLMLAANYMDMQPLLYIGAAKTATLVKGQPLDKIKSQLAINRRPEGKEEENPESKEEKKKKTSPNPGAKKKVKRGSR